MLRFLYVYIPHLSRHRSSSNSSIFAALCATDVRGFESPLGIDRSRDCCRYHDSYPYSPSALWTLFAFKIQVRTDCATRQTPKFCRISLTCWIQNRALASLPQDAVVAAGQLLFLSMDTHGLLRFLSAHHGETKITRMIDTSDVLHSHSVIFYFLHISFYGIYVNILILMLTFAHLGSTFNPIIWTRFALIHQG